MDYQSLYQGYKDAGLTDQEINTIITDQLSGGHLDPTQIFSTPEQSYILGKPTQETQNYGNYNPGVEVMSGGTNTGADFSADVGTPVALPPGQWEVISSYNGAKDGYIGDNENSGYGNSIKVKNTKTGEHLRLSHLSQVGVAQGQIVDGGKVIAATGKTGNVTGPHLDLEYYDQNGNLGDVMTSPYGQYLPVSGGSAMSYPSGNVPYTAATQSAPISAPSQVAPQKVLDSSNGFGNDVLIGGQSPYGQGGGNPVLDTLQNAGSNVDKFVFDNIITPLNPNAPAIVHNQGNKPYLSPLAQNNTKPMPSMQPKQEILDNVSQAFKFTQQPQIAAQEEYPEGATEYEKQAAPIFKDQGVPPAIGLGIYAMEGRGKTINPNNPYNIGAYDSNPQNANSYPFKTPIEGTQEAAKFLAGKSQYQSENVKKIFQDALVEYKKTGDYDTYLAKIAPTYSTNPHYTSVVQQTPEYQRWSYNSK